MTRVFEFVNTFLFFLNSTDHIVEESRNLCCAAAASVDCNACLIQSGDVLCAVGAGHDGPEGHLHLTLHLLASEQRITAALPPRRETNNFSNCL